MVKALACHRKVNLVIVADLVVNTSAEETQRRARATMTRNGMILMVRRKDSLTLDTEEA